MPKEYARDQIWKLLKTLPAELREALSSDETTEHIYNVCQKYDLLDKRGSQIAKYIGRVLLGVLVPEDFQETLEKEVKLEKDVASKVAQEINRYIFFPVKESLVQFREQKAKVKTESKKEEPAEEGPAQATAPSEERPEKTPGKDVYREPVE